MVPPNSGEKYKFLGHESDRLIRRTKMSASSAAMMVSVTGATSNAFSAIRTSAFPFELKTCQQMASKWLSSSINKPALFALHERNSSFIMQKVNSPVKKTWRPNILAQRPWVVSLIAEILS